MAVRVNNRVVMLVGLLVLVLVAPTLISGQAEGETTASSLLGDWADFWLVRLSFNLFAYGTFALIGYAIIRWARQTNYVERAGPTWTAALVRLFVHGSEADKATVEEGATKAATAAPAGERSAGVTVMIMGWCAGGLLTCYLMWGVMQERIMSVKYGATDTSEGEHFKNSTFLVFVNRILALVVALSCILWKYRSQPRHTAPLYKYSYSSFSNIMSSWFQYEALKFVSFPTQVLAKSCKVIAVMVMGSVMSSKVYKLYEKVTAVMITLGVALFMYYSKDATKSGGTVTTASGLILLAGYLSFDAFTSNWQGELFKAHKMTSHQMMAGVNLFSVLFTTVALLEQGGFVESLAFMVRHWEFFYHAMLLSLMSAVGQLFIFYTIAEFGPVVFTIIMTLRQALAILVSCVLYHHPISLPSLVGIIVVFIAIGLRMHYGQKERKKAAKAKQAAAATAAEGSTQRV